MSTHKYIDRICCAATAFALVLTVLLVNAGRLGVVPAMAQPGYGAGLFDSSRVHAIDIQMEGWEAFLETCENEEYSACSVTIDGETVKNVGIRAKGNTSLSSVAAYGNQRYSFKIEFDCYEKGNSYQGLDKISLNNIIQDNTYMKDFLAYQMMGGFGVASPLCSYAYLTVNGEDWGLYLAVEAVEESFLARNYGNSYGNLYKPDSREMDGGRGEGGGLWREGIEGPLGSQDGRVPVGEGFPEGPPEGVGMPEGSRQPPMAEEEREFQRQEEGGMPQMPEGGNPKGPGGGPGGMGSDDVALIYSGDDYDSYPNIFGNAKTEISRADKDRLIASLKKLAQGEDIESIVDVEAVARYFVVHNFVCNFDSYTGSLMHNYYLYEKDGKLSMVPWDYNLAFGGFGDGTDAKAMVNYPIDSPLSGASLAERPMLAWIFASEEYTEMYHQYFQEFLDSYFASGYFEEMISSVKEMIAPYVEKDPTKFCTFEAFEKGVSTLEEFCLLRAQSISGQLAGTIPATLEAQAADSKALVEASGISLSDMGSMGQGGKGRQNHREMIEKEGDEWKK